MASVSRSEFLRRVSDRAGAHKRDVEHVWENALAVIQESIRKGEAVSISGFGKFKQRATKARKAGMQKNPFTGEMQKVAAKPASKAPKFLPAKQFKEYVAGTLKSLPTASTKPMALAGDGGKAAPKKAAAKKTAKKAPAKKAAAKKPAAKKKAPAKKAAAKKRR